MFLFQTLAPTIILIVSLITATSMRGKKIPKNKKKTVKTITTTLITCILLISILGQIHPTQAQTPTQETGTGTTYTATEHVTGVNTTTETYTTKNTYQNTERKTTLKTTQPQGFNQQGNILITVVNLTATEDSRVIEDISINDIYPNTRDWVGVSMTFNITENIVNVTQLWVWYGASGTPGPTGIFDIRGVNPDGTPNSTSYLPAPISLDTPTGGWHEMLGGSTVTLQKGQYSVITIKTSGGDPQIYSWRCVYDNSTGDNSDDGIGCYNNGVSWIKPSPGIDGPLRLTVIPLNPVDPSKIREYSSADQVDMRVNSTIIGGDNIVSFSYSSYGVFVFTTNTSVVFQKNWTATFVRGSISVSSSYKVDTTTCLWNLTYNLESVTGGSATAYSDRGINITSIPSSWSVDSANPGTAVKYGNIIVVSLSDNDAHANAFVICNFPKANIDFEIGEYDILYGRTVSISFRFHYGGTGFMADTVTLNGTVHEWSYEGDGWHNITYDTESLDSVGTFLLVIQVNNDEFAALGQVILYVSEISQKGFLEQLLDNFIYIVLLILGAFGAIALTQLYYAKKQELFDRQNILRIMVVWEGFALYDQIASDAIGNGRLVDKELVSGLFSAIKNITVEVTGATLDFRKVYPNHPYYFVYKGTFYCVLILKEKPSSRLEEKLLLFARIVEEKYGETFEEEYRRPYSRGLGIPEIRLDLDDEIMQIFNITPVTTLELMQTFGIIPPTELQDIVTVSLSYEEIEELKGRDDVKTVLMTGRKLTDNLEKFPLEKLIQEATKALGDIRIAHSATLEALESRLITVAEKAAIPEEEPKEGDKA